MGTAVEKTLRETRGHHDDYTDVNSSMEEDDSKKGVDNGGDLIFEGFRSLKNQTQ